VSYTVELDGESVWEPANQVGELYIGMVGTVAEMLGVPAGLTELSGDWYSIDRIVYPAMVRDMLRAFARSGHWEFRLLVGSVLAVSIGILDRGKIPIAGETEDERKALVQLRDTFL
jgi:hypothetical protein